MIHYSHGESNSIKVEKVTVSKDEEHPLDSEASHSSEEEVNHWYSKKNVFYFVEHSCTQIFVLLVTFYALFGDDIRLLSFGKEADDVFMYLNIIAMAVFGIEIVLSCYSKPDYFNSFFFWLDLISTISIITDIEPVWDAITGANNEEAEGAADAGTLARASRGARIGTKAGRMTRVIRLIRLVRIVKLYKQSQSMVDETI